MTLPFTAIAAALDAAVFVTLLVNERHQARSNDRPVRRWVLVVTGALAAGAVVLALSALASR